MLQVSPITIHDIWKDHERKDQPLKEILVIKGAVNHFLLHLWIQFLHARR